MIEEEKSGRGDSWQLSSKNWEINEKDFKKRSTQRFSVDRKREER